jgi:hypothetical protein
MKIFLVSLFISCLFGLRSEAQLIFFSKPVERQTADSIYFEYSHKYFYSYFWQKYDSILVDFEPSELENILQVASISKTTNCGKLEYFLNEKIIHRYEINHGKVNGIGIVFNNFLDVSNGVPVRQATFINNKISGVDIWFDYKTGVVYKVSTFKKGKFIKILYQYTQL